jgi:hypothetical protein
MWFSDDGIACAIPSGFLTARFLASLEMTAAMRGIKRRLVGGFAANQPYPIFLENGRHSERSEEPRKACAGNLIRKPLSHQYKKLNPYCLSNIFPYICRQ